METKKTLVLGASTNPARYSNMAIIKLVRHEQPVCAIGLRPGMVAGVEILTGKPALKQVHTITMYINPKRQPEYYDYLIDLKPKRVIFNPGTENPTFYEMLKKEGVEVDPACTLVLLASQQY
ncbi:MAG TPA: CoA-binding protein [Leeuwenhoekiella sp.]|nr:CoA-binding protein [Leeuwenhoekiella sp.]